MMLTDKLTAMMLWEQGRLSESDTATLFQELVNTGEAWKLQGAYGRVASALIQNGTITAPAAPRRAPEAPWFTIGLLVKAGPGARESALQRLDAWLNSETHEPPYAPGSLLNYTFGPDYIPRWDGGASNHAD